MYTINGKFLGRKMMGQIRVAKEIILELDKLVRPGMVEIVAPHSRFDMEGLKNISVVRVGGGNLHLWEQTYLWLYVCRKKRTLVNFTNSHPLFRADISYIHDTLFKAYPHIYYHTLSGAAAEWYNLLMIGLTVRLAGKIVTVSEFSKKEIIKYYHVPGEKITVIPNAWQHMLRIREDDRILSRYPLIEPGQYYLAVSGIAPHKNFRWILENARRYPGSRYVIVGKKEKSTDLELESGENLLYLDNVTDGEMKALMRHCRAFVHPAVYEGFALTPMEAMGAGCRQVIVSRAACLPEIYQDGVSYLDPGNSSCDLGKMGLQTEEDRKKVLEQYSWKHSAEKLYGLLFPSK